MKYFKQLFVLFVVVFLTTHSVIAADDPNLNEIDYLKKIDLIHLELKDGLVSTQKTGHLNADFLNQALEYQRALIALSKNELQYGERQELKEPVNQLIHRFKLNLKKINKVQKKISENPTFDEAKESAYLSSYEGIYQQILNELKGENEAPTALLGDSIDADFLIRILKQSEVWTVFVNNVLQQTESQEVKELASDLIKSNELLKEDISKLMNQMKE